MWASQWWAKNTLAFTQSDTGKKGKVLSQGVTQSDSGLDGFNGKHQMRVKYDCEVLGLNNYKLVFPLAEVGKTVWSRFVTDQQFSFGHTMLEMSISKHPRGDTKKAAGYRSLKFQKGAWPEDVTSAHI